MFPSEDLVRGDANHVRAGAAIRVDATQPVPPLDGREHAEGSGRFERRAESRVVARSGSKSGIVNLRCIEEPIDPERPRGGPANRAPENVAAIVPDQRRWIPVQAVVERPEGVAAEAIEIVPIHPGRFESSSKTRTNRQRAGHAEAVLLEVRL